ncbi:AI-2E family transporter [Clostridium sp. DL1XJH146]
MIKTFKEDSIFLNLLIITCIFIILGYILKHYFFIILVSIMFYLFSKPIYNLMNSTNENKNFNAGISICLINAIIFIFIFFAGKVTLLKIYNFIINNFTIDDEMLNKLLLTYYDNLKEKIQFFNFRISLISKYFLQNELIRKSAIYTMDGFLSFFIGNIVAYFLLLDKMIIIDIINRIFPDFNTDNMINKISIIKNIFIMQIIFSLITILATTCAFLLLKIPSPIYLGILCGILDILPYIGMIIVFIPLIILKIKVQEIFSAITLALVYISMIFFRQLVENKIVSDKFNIHPLAMIICLYIFMKFFGIIGVFVAPLYLISVKELIFRKG